MLVFAEICLHHSMLDYIIALDGLTVSCADGAGGEEVLKQVKVNGRCFLDVKIFIWKRLYKH